MSHSISQPRRLGAKGFTLVEVMVVVAIIAILSAIAFPSYQNYLKRTHRSAVESLMLDLANREQQYLLDQRSFLGGGTSAVTTLLGGAVPPEVDPYYTVSITAGTPPPTFTITASPKAGIMAGDGDLTLDQAGLKSPAAKWEGR